MLSPSLRSRLLMLWHRLRGSFFRWAGHMSRLLLFDTFGRRPERLKDCCDWVVLGLFIVVMLSICYNVTTTLVHAGSTRRDHAKLVVERGLYRSRITADSTLIEHLRHDQGLEQYAREHYHLQRPTEELYHLLP